MERPFTVMTIEHGRSVVCDFCGEDYTDSQETGGLMFGSYATCPKCAPDMEKDAVTHGEQDRIRARCPANKSFADWVREDIRQ